MKRVLVLSVAACGASAPRTQPAPAPVEPAPVEPAHVEQPRMPSSQIVDTSIAGVWAPTEPHVQAPLSPAPTEPAEEERVAIAMPRPRLPGRRAPCFANRDVLVGAEIWHDLTQYAVGMSSDDPPRGTYGTCTIEHGQLRDARGTLLAELHCGITVYAPGIIDDLGFEIGARGSAIAAEYPTHDMLCWGDDDTHTRCWFQTGDGEEPGSHYIVAGVLDKDDREPVRGAAARGFFTSRTVSHFTVRITCH
jgi:hypothetical protein